MARVVRPKDEKPGSRKKVSGSRFQVPENPETGKESGIRCQVPAAKSAGKVTEKELWDLRRQVAGALNRIDELEAQVLILARGGKEKEFYSVEEAAEIWGVSKSNLYLMIRQGRLPAIRIGEAVRIARGTLINGPTN